ncbi:MAG TPA: carbonic anhydrase [Rickettsiales bacterium]|nr:carbonic anhydrase [Rickettsiales bacterium]
MTDSPILGLIQGYKNFYRKYTSERFEEYRQQAAKGQSPKVMVIACSDSRVHPSIVMRSGLGEVFQVCNVANLVPPYRPDKGTHHSTSAALEFAVGTLNVEHVVIMGHSGCGGIRSLLDGAPVALDGEYSFIAQWVDIASQAKSKVKDLPPEERYHCCELEALKTSLSNLMGFPWVAERVVQGTLTVHAWHFDIETGVIIAYDAKTDTFSPLAEE